MAENAMRIDMVRPVRQLNPIKRGSDAQEAKETGFADMMKRKEQLSEDAGQDDEPSVHNSAGDNEVGAGETKPESEGGDASLKQDEMVKTELSSEAMLQLQTAISQLLENHKADNALDFSDLAQAVRETKAVDAVMLPASQMADGEAAEAGKTEIVPEFTQHMKWENTPQQTEAHIQNSVQNQIPNQNLQESHVIAMKARESDAVPVNEGGKETDEFRQMIHENVEAKQEAATEISKQPPRDENSSGGSDKSAGSRESAWTEGEPEQITGQTERFATRSVESRQPDAPVLKTAPETLPNDLGKTLAQSLPKQNGTLTIELEPASLGKLTISVVYEEGKAAVSILASNPKTLELLSQRVVDIAGILEEKTGQQTVIYTQEPEQQSFDERQDNQEKEHQRQDREENKRQSQPDSFAQQLRLGLV